MYMVTTEEEIDEGQEEDVEVPKAMGDIFESIAGAIYLVWFDVAREDDVLLCRIVVETWISSGESSSIS